MQRSKTKKNERGTKVISVLMMMILIVTYSKALELMSMVAVALMLLMVMVMVYSSTLSKMRIVERKLPKPRRVDANKAIVGNTFTTSVMSSRQEVVF